ncbi:hypothetical protein ABPG74_001891 [Tetrahymena malaccensis]
MSIEQTTDIMTIEQVIGCLKYDKNEQFELLASYLCQQQVKSLTKCEETIEATQKIIPYTSQLQRQFKTILQVANDSNSFYRAVFIHFLINLYANGSDLQIEYFQRTIYQFIERDIKFTSIYKELELIDKQIIAVHFLAFLGECSQQKQINKNQAVSYILNKFSTNCILDFIAIVICKNLFYNCYERYGPSEAIERIDQIYVEEETKQSLETTEKMINSQIISLASEVFQSTINIYLIDDQNTKEIKLNPFINEGKNQINILLSNNNYYIVLKNEMDSLNLQKFDKRSLKSQLLNQPSMELQNQVERYGNCDHCQKKTNTIFLDFKYYCEECLIAYTMQKSEIKIVNQDCKISLEKEIQETIKMFEKAAEMNKKYYKSKKILQKMNSKCSSCQKVTTTYLVLDQNLCLEDIKHYASQYVGKKFKNTTSDDCKHALDLINNKLIEQISSNQQTQNLYQQFNSNGQQKIIQQGYNYFNKQGNQQQQQCQKINQPQNNYQQQIQNKANNNQIQYNQANQNQNQYLNNNQINQNQGFNYANNQFQNQNNLQQQQFNNGQYQPQYLPQQNQYQGQQFFVQNQIDQNQALNSPNNQFQQQPNFQPYQFQRKCSIQQLPCIQQQEQQYNNQVFQNQVQNFPLNQIQQQNYMNQFLQEWPQQYQPMNQHQNQGYNNHNGQIQQENNEIQNIQQNIQPQFFFSKNPVDNKKFDITNQGNFFYQNN